MLNSTSVQRALITVGLTKLSGVRAAGQWMVGQWTVGQFKSVLHKKLSLGVISTKFSTDNVQDVLDKKKYVIELKMQKDCQFSGWLPHYVQKKVLKAELEYEQIYINNT